MDVLDSKESGEKYRLHVDGLGYDVEIPYVLVPGGDGDIRIASFNLIGLTRLNADLGRLLAEKIRCEVADYHSVVVLTAVEKALQLTGILVNARHQPPGLMLIEITYRELDYVTKDEDQE